MYCTFRLSTFAGISRRISPRFCLTEHMNRGRDQRADRGSSSRPRGNSPICFHHLAENGSSHTERNEQGKYFRSAAQMKSNESNCRPASDNVNGRVRSSDTTSIHLSLKHGYLSQRRSRIHLGAEAKTQDVNSSQNEILPVKSFTSDQNISLPTQFGKKRILTYRKRSKSCPSYYKHAATEGLREVKPFDICLPRCRNTGFLKSYLHKEDDENQNIVEHTIQENRQVVLQPGMVLLKHYISHNHQVNIVNTCRELGLGPGGFYRPGYQDGAKLRLQMMCLGLNWDPETRKYKDQRPIDGCKPPGIPCQFISLVEKAIQYAHALIGRDIKLSNPEDMLPAMSPNICIVNFYTTSGRLGLHQDRDESSESLRKGLPVVSFSVGDSAEFLYGDQRDMDKAEKLVLESGDVLIFGGKSRHIFHGVTSIVPNSTPKALVEEIGIRPGRLNLTFRQF